MQDHDTPRRGHARQQVATRKNQIIAAAFNIAKELGLAAVSQTAVAKRMGVSRPLVVKYFKADALKDAVISQAINERNLPLIAQGLAINNAVAQSAPVDVRERAVAQLLNP